MSLFAKYFEPSSDSDEEEQEEEQKPIPRVFTATLEEGFRVEKKDLMNDHQSHKVEELEQMREAIFKFLDGAQERLKGCKTIAPVRSFIRERVEATAPFFYLSGNRPLSKEEWTFIQRNGNSILRILHNTFNPYVYPAHLLLDEYTEVLVKTHTDVSTKLRREFQNRTKRQICAELGSNDQEVASFVEKNPSAKLNEHRLMQKVAEKLNFVGGEGFVRDMLDALPPGIMTFSMRSMAEQLDEVNATASRDNSPERERKSTETEEMEETDEEEDEEEDIGPLELYFPPPPPSTKPVPKQQGVRSILKTDKTWYRSDDTPVINKPLFGRVTYAEYSETKKKVSFKSLLPTECFVYYIDRRNRHKRFRIYLVPRTGHTWGFKTTYEDFERMERYPNRDRFLRRDGSAHTSHTQAQIKSSRLRMVWKKNDWKSRETVKFWKKLFPTQFLKSVPLRDNIYKGMGGTAREIPAHAEKRERDLGQIVNTDFLLNNYCEKMAAFGKHWLKLNLGKDTRPTVKEVYGILILTDSVFEDVNPCTLLNAALFPFPPPMNYSDAVNILIEHWEVSDGIHDVILSWGFEQLIIERDATEAFASLLMFAMEVKTVLDENVMKIATDRAEWDVVEVPKIWLFTIPEAPYRDAELFKKYNILVRNFCQEESDFHLIDWAMAWYDAPPQFAYPDENGGSVAERSLQLFFRVCREKMDLLYRRPLGERTFQVEAENLGTFGTGPWLKDIYQIFEETEEADQDDGPLTPVVNGDSGEEAGLQEQNMVMPWEETMETTPQFSHPQLEPFQKAKQTKHIKIEPVS